MSKSHKGVQKPKVHLPYCERLGQHHMQFEARHQTRGWEKMVRNYGAFILSTEIAQPPQHTLLHRSMTEPPRPEKNEAYNLVDTAKEGGLSLVLDTIDTRLTEHYRQQMAILAIPKQEAIERLTLKMFIKQYGI